MVCPFGGGTGDGLPEISKLFPRRMLATALISLFILASGDINGTIDIHVAINYEYGDKVEKASQSQR